mgnify:FL=1
MATRTPFGRPGRPGGFDLIGSGSPPPRDVLVILGVLFVTFSLQFFESTAIVPRLLQLTPLVLRGFLWQLVTYPVVGTRGSGFWFLLELLILFWFARDVYWRIGQRRFWQLLLWGSVGAAVVAVLVLLVTMLFGGSVTAVPFLTMQGQRMLLTITIAAFATLYGEATIMLFFVLPIRARWFLSLEILFSFVFGLLQTKDHPGFLGVCPAVFLTYSTLMPGGPLTDLHNWRMRIEQLIIQQRLKKMRRRRSFDVIEGDRNEWIH